MNFLHFLRMSYWVRNPPSAQRVKLVLVVVVVCLVILGIEYAGLWPDWATREPRAPGRIPRVGLSG
ncbi:hypothetical protein ACFORG_21925 [Lutimaribacter marinistellae]|uniref:Uncharacterized protein n=1 Tax=Lutimaribacter marinistellae TaxID=1820329 RepID=A0ABV7TM77_9RHOB